MQKNNQLTAVYTIAIAALIISGVSLLFSLRKTNTSMGTQQQLQKKQSLLNPKANSASAGACYGDFEGCASTCDLAFSGTNDAMQVDGNGETSLNTECRGACSDTYVECVKAADPFYH